MIRVTVGGDDAAGATAWEEIAPVARELAHVLA